MREPLVLGCTAVHRYKVFENLPNDTKCLKICQMIQVKQVIQEPLVLGCTTVHRYKVFENLPNDTIILQIKVTNTMHATYK